MNDHNVSCRIRLNINKIRLKVRFSCSISCSLKIQGTQHEIPGEVELKNGQATLNSTFIQTTSINMSKTSAYSSQKKIALLVYLKSSSGRIPAGTVPLPLSHNGSFTKRQMAHIEKCPDKNAYIEYEFSLQRMEGFPQSHQSVIQKVLYPIRSDPRLRNSAAMRNYSPARYLENNSQLKHLRGSKVDGSIMGKETVPIKRMGAKKADSGYSLLQEYYTKEKDREASHEKIYGLEREVEGQKTKMSIIQCELNTKSMRVVELQKQAKQFQKKSESLQLQLKANQSKYEVLQKTNKDMSIQVKSLKEKLEEDKLNAENIIKRVEIREMSLKEQIKSLTEKVYTSENDKQRMLFEKSVSSNEFEERQKKIRETFKDKEKKMIQERTTLVKKIDLLERDLQKSAEQLSQSKSKSSEALQVSHQLRLLVQTLQTQNERYRNQASDLRYQLTKLRNQRKILEQNLQNNSKFNQERRSYRKQLNQKQIQITRLKEKVNQFESQLTKMKNNSEENEKMLKEKTNQLKLLERDYNMLMKEHNFISSQLSSKEIKLNNVLQELQSQMMKVKLSQSKCFQLETRLEEEQDSVHSHKMDANSRITALSQEIQKLNTDLYQSHQSITSLSKQNEQLEQLIEDKNQLIHNLESNLIQLNQANQSFQLQKIELAQQKKQMEEQLQKKIEGLEEEVKQLNARIAQIVEENQMKLSNVKNQYQKQRSAVSEFDGMIKEREELMAKNNAKIIRLQREIENWKNINEQQKEDINILESEKKALGQKLNKLTKECSDKEVILNSVRGQNGQFESQLTDLQGKLELMQGDYNKKEKELKMLKDSYESYKIMSNQALTILSSQIGSTMSQVIIQHSNQQFCQKANDFLHKMILDSMQKNNKLKTLQKTIQSLQKMVTSLQEQKSGKQINLLTTSKDLQLLKQSTVEYNYELQTKNELIEMLKNETKKKEDEITMKNGEFQIKLSMINKNISEKNKEIIELKQNISQKSILIEDFQDKITDLQRKLKTIEKDKRSFQTQNKQKITQVDTNLRLQMEKVNYLQSQKNNMEKQLKQERDNVRKTMRELQNKCYEYEQLEHKYLDCQNAFNLKETQAKKFKQLYNELKQIQDTMITAIQSLKMSSTTTKLQTLISKCENKENLTIFEKLKSFYEGIISLFNSDKQKMSKIAELEQHLGDLTQQLMLMKKQNEKTKLENMKFSTEIKRQRDEEIAFMSQDNTKLKQTISNLQAEISQKQKEKKMLKKEIQQMNKSKIDDLKSKEKQKEVLLEILKFVDEQKALMEILRKMAEDILKTINILEKQKKVSMFAMNPVKDPLKKLQQSLAGLAKDTGQLIKKNQREFDLANLRKKKFSTQ